MTKDDPLETLEESVQDAVNVADILTEEDERQYNADHVLALTEMLYSERMGRKNHDWMQEQMGGSGSDEHNSVPGGPAWQ